MASNINPNNIDGNYPVAGQDNNSQGFRDNFSNIKNNLAFTKAELEDLQNKVLLKSALTGGALSNDLNNEKLINAQLQSFTEYFYNLGAVTGTATLNYANGNYQKFTTSGAVTVAFSNWPVSGTIGRMVVHMNIVNVGHTVILPATVSVDNATILGLNTDTNQITFAEIGEYVFEFVSYEGQNRFKITDLSRNRDKVKGTFTVDGALVLANPVVPASSAAIGTPGQMSWDNGFLYVCVATDTWKRVALTSF